MRSSLRRRRRHAVAGLIYRLLLLVPLTASMVGQGQTSAVPRLVRFSGVVKDAQGNPRSGAVGVTFGLYKDEQGGSPLWLETQNVQADAQGHYTVSLGATLANGLPQDLFVSGEARWLGVRPEGQSEQPRTLLMSVPYALKAGDAETIGGRPASAFMLAPADAAGSSQNSVPPDGTITGGGTANFVPLFTGTTTIGNSKVFQTAGGDIGIGTTKPAAALDVKGKADVRDTLTLIPKTTNPTLSVKGTVFAVSSTGVVTFAGGQTFPGTGTITGVAAGTDLTGGGNSGNVTLNVDTTKVVTGITAGTDLTGGGTGGVQTLNLDTTKVPQLNSPNTFTANQSVTGNLTASGTVTGAVINAAGSFQLGGTTFAFGSTTNSNAFLGFAGNFTTTGNNDTASGYQALQANTTGNYITAIGSQALVSNVDGGYDTATGAYALYQNTGGVDNTATGYVAMKNNTTGFGNTGDGSGVLYSNTTGLRNSALGDNALESNTTGSYNTAGGFASLYANIDGTYNTAFGYFASPDESHGSLTNATAIGAFAEVTANNAMVLGSIQGVNGATADTFVGIGTTAPAAKLDVHGTGNFTGLITFAAGQTFPGTGTITGVTAGTDLTGGGASGNVTLSVDTTKVVTGITAGTDLTGGGTGGVQTINLDTSKVPQLGTSNLFVGTQAIHGGDLTLDAGNLNLPNTGAITLGGTRFLSTSSVAPRGNTSLGLGTFNPNGSGEGNTATGTYALASNSTGSDNTATGMYALFLATGDGNTAVGTDALYHTLTSGNAAVGVNALFSNTGGTLNTAIGAAALEFNNTGSYNTGLGSNTTGPQSYDVSNATAIGAFAEVDESNAMVLGSINGVNFATADTNVGIGTTQPQTLLHIDHAPPSGGQDVVLVTSGGSSNVASMLLQSTAPGQRLRVGTGTDASYLASSGILKFFTADTGSPNSPTGPAMTMDTSGNVYIPGNLSKGGGSFEIDHPLDPANKYLYHSFVESPDMMNVYNGNVTTDRRGFAEITLPDYFDALNRDFRYQLTVIGQFAQAIVAKEISHNRFTIRTNRPGVKVSWQVTGIRQDAYANAHRIPVEVEKPPQEQGKYLHPELFGAPREAQVGGVLSLPPATAIRNQLASSAVGPK